MQVLFRRNSRVSEGVVLINDADDIVFDQGRDVQISWWFWPVTNHHIQFAIGQCKLVVVVGTELTNDQACMGRLVP